MKSEIYLQPNNIYSHLGFEEYCNQIIPEFYFKAEVPVEVLQNFEVVEKLIAFGYYEHKFIDEAFAKSLVTFEMGMKIKAKELKCYSKGDMFHALIKNLSALDIFDTPFEELKRTKETRNHFFHPESHSYGGVTFINRIKSIVGLINEMYEDKILRLERNSLKENFLQNQKELKLQYGLYLETKPQNGILFNLTLVLVNNKTFPITYDLTFSPITDLECQDERSYRQPRVIHAKIIDPEFKNDKLTVTNLMSGEKLSFTPVQNNELANLNFEKWKNNLSKIEYGFLIETVISFWNYELLHQQMDLFHKM